MGRPLNKKYFGNRNIGTGGDQTIGNLSNSQNYADDRIGGQGVASYNSIVAGSGWTTIPTVTFSAPDLPDGVSVAGIAHYKALSFATTANGTGYAVGNVLEVDTGTQTTKARAPVAAIVSVATPNITNGGTLYDVTNPSIGDKITFTHANLATALRVRATAVSGSTITAIVVEQAGVWNGTTFPSSMANGVGGFTATTSGGPVDNNGNGLVLGFTQSMWGAFSFGTVSVAGDYTAFPSTGGAGTLTSVSPATGTGAKADITMGLLSIEITEQGSGYTAPSDAAVSFSGATGAAATAVLTVDTGAVGSSTNQENAIIIRANVSGSGSTASICDIIRQVSTRRYKVTDGTNIGIVEIGTDSSPENGEGFITATDSGGATYFVTKLTAHKATLVNRTGTPMFSDNTAVPWDFTASTGVVAIENA